MQDISVHLAMCDADIQTFFFPFSSNFVWKGTAYGMRKLVHFVFKYNEIGIVCVCMCERGEGMGFSDLALLKYVIY